MFISNREDAQELINSIEDGGCEKVVKAIIVSDELLKATLNSDEDKVAKLIDHAYSDNISLSKYNDGNSMSCVLSLAYYYARKIYTIERECLADLIFKLRKNNNNLQ